MGGILLLVHCSLNAALKRCRSRAASFKSFRLTLSERLTTAAWPPPASGVSSTTNYSTGCIGNFGILPIIFVDIRDIQDIILYNLPDD